MCCNDSIKLEGMTEMIGKEIKVSLDEASREMSFYRMEGGRWCLIDDSDDDLRPYIREKAASDA